MFPSPLWGGVGVGVGRQGAGVDDTFASVFAGSHRPHPHRSLPKSLHLGACKRDPGGEGEDQRHHGLKLPCMPGLPSNAYHISLFNHAVFNHTRYGCDTFGRF
jgi:hypothetical protein